jgi:L-threonylcarbamoyladenylate synthase
MKKKPLELTKQLNAGGIGVLPTDTLYGLVGQALNKPAVERIYAVKGRAPEKPCIILVAEISDLKKFGVVIDEVVGGLIGRLWPGPVSIILPCSVFEFEYLHRGTNSLAFRLPADSSLRELLAQTGPLIAPSANPEGQPPAKTIAQAQAYFGDKVDFYLPSEALAKAGEDEGELQGAPSTLITIENGRVRILRQGSATIPTELL